MHYGLWGRNHSSKSNFQRSFLERAHAKDGESKEIALLVHFLHYLIVFSGAKEAGLLIKNNFQKISFRVEPHFYLFGGHKSAIFAASP